MRKQKKHKKGKKKNWRAFVPKSITPTFLGSRLFNHNQMFSWPEMNEIKH